MPTIAAKQKKILSYIHKSPRPSRPAALTPTNNLDPVQFDELVGQAMDGNHLLTMPSEFYRSVTQQQISVFCLRKALYGLPTTELVEWLREEIGDRKTIEIASGNGCLARALGIPGTDSRHQEDHSVKLQFLMMGQPTVTYGTHVEKLNHRQAIAKYQPEIVIGSWVTRRYDPKFPKLGGNAEGVEDAWLLARCGKYILIGHDATHWSLDIMRVPHETFRLPCLFSRSMQTEGNFVKVWNTDNL